MNVDLTITREEQRALMEHALGPCFRMWLDPTEWAIAKKTTDWTAHPLKDGRYAVWRKESDVQKLLDSGDTSDAVLAKYINARRLADDVD